MILYHTNIHISGKISKNGFFIMCNPLAITITHLWLFNDVKLIIFWGLLRVWLITSKYTVMPS